MGLWLPASLTGPASKSPGSQIGSPTNRKRWFQIAHFRPLVSTLTPPQTFLPVGFPTPISFWVSARHRGRWLTPLRKQVLTEWPPLVPILMASLLSTGARFWWQDLKSTGEAFRRTNWQHVLQNYSFFSQVFNKCWWAPYPFESVNMRWALKCTVKSCPSKNKTK